MTKLTRPHRKRAKNIYDVDQAKKKFKAPLDHLVCSTVKKYSIQLNIYKRIIEKRYGLTVENMFLLVFHPNYQGYQKIPVENISQSDLDALFKTHHDQSVHNAKIHCMTLIMFRDATVARKVANAVLKMIPKPTSGQPKKPAAKCARQST